MGLVLGSGGDVVGGTRRLSSLADHVGSLGLTAESLHNHASDLVRVRVGSRPAVLKVALALHGDGTVDAHR